MYTPYGHAGIVVDCPYDRTMFECILVLSLSYLYVHAVSLWAVPIVDVRLRVSLLCGCPRHLSTQVALRPVPVAGLCGPGVTCFPVGLPSGAGGQVYLSWLYPPYGHVCDDRLRFDPLDRSMWP